MINDAAYLRRWLRREAGIGPRSRDNAIPVEIDYTPAGSRRAPHVAGESYYWTTPGGAAIYHPSAYARAGGWRQVYNHSTLRVVAGADWIIRNAPL